MPQATVHRKKHGYSRKRSRSFLKVYAPYIPLILIISTGIYIGNFFHHVAARNNSGVLAYATEMSVNGLLTSTNQQRSSNGAGNLSVNSKLASAAQAKANDMAARNYWSHNTPDGNPPWVFITKAGYSYDEAGENLAYGFKTSSETVQGWMNSPSHRENLLNKDFTEVGFGFTNASNYNQDGEETIIVAMYAKPYTVSAAQPTPPAPVAVAPPTVKQTTTTTTEATPKHTVEVKILDDDDKPVPNILVTLHSKPRTAKTGADGVAVFADVEEGEHVATAEVKGSKREHSLTVTADSKTVSVTLPEPVSGKLSTTSASSSTTTTSHSVNRLQLLARSAASTLLIVMVLLAMAGGGYVIGKHSRALHRLLTKGERYVLEHSLLDVTIISFVWLCFIVSRTAGFIL